MIYSAKNYEHLLGTPGFSDELLKSHLALYKGYVKQTNALIETLKRYREERQENLPEFMELRRRFGWEFNGMRLHEYYFENIKKDSGEGFESTELKEKIVEDFGSMEAWKKDFKAAGAMRGIGWVILAYDPMAHHLLNLWINEHDTGHGAGLSLLLVMDVFEHAYMQDYGINKKDYIQAFFEVIHWEEVSKRFQNISAAHPSLLRGFHVA